MSGSDRPRFRRPWEAPESPESEPPDDSTGEQAEALAAGDPVSSDDPVPPPQPTSQVDLSDWEKMAPSRLDDLSQGSDDLSQESHDLSQESYVNATTEEYRGLAAEISRLRGESFDPQAVSATMAGVDQGLVGFEDVTGRRGVTEEDVEAAEQARSSDLALRVASAVVLVGVFLGSLSLGGWWFTIFLSLMMAVSLGELYATMRKVGYAPLALIGLLGVMLMPVVMHRSGVFSFAGVAMAATVATVLAFSLVQRRHPLDNASVTVFGMMWVGLLTFAVPIAETANPVAMVLFVAFVTAMVDMGSYFVGRGFGNRALAPNLSPTKTVEGLLGGVAVAVLTAAVFSTFPPYADLGFNGSIMLGLLISLVAPVGDLAESMIKRSLGVKDMGSILPGHGGMLDRIDSFLFSVPAAYIFLLIVGLI